MTAPTPVAERTGFIAWLRALPRWKKVMLALAVVLVGAGIAFAIVESGQPAPTEGGSDSGVRTSFLPGSQPTGQPAPAQEPASAGFFRLGFSFIAGFCIGYAVRKTLKLTALFAGLLLLFLFLLSWSELITVHWQAIDTWFDRLSARVGREAESLRTFITGSLPAAGLAAAGLVAGFKKN